MTNPRPSKFQSKLALTHGGGAKHKKKKEEILRAKITEQNFFRSQTRANLVQFHFEAFAAICRNLGALSPPPQSKFT